MSNKRGIFTSAKKQISKGVVIIAALFAFLAIVGIRNASAEATYMSASTDSDDGWIDFSPGIEGAVANFSYMKSGSVGSISKIYDAKITLRNLPEDKSKRLSVNLPVGMYWQDDGAADNYILSQLDASYGTNGIVKTPVSAEPIMGYSYTNSGARDYYLQKGTEAVVLNIKIRVDWQLDLSYISDAVVAKLYIDDAEIESAHIDVNTPSGQNTGGNFYNSSNRMYVNPGMTYQTDKGYYRLIRAQWINGHYSVNRPIKQVIFEMTFDDPSARIVLRGAGAGWTLDDSASAEGKYILTRTTTTFNNGEFSLPYAVVIPDDAPGGKVYTLQSTAKTVIAQTGGAEDRVIDFRNTQKHYFEVLPSSGLVTIGMSTLDPANQNTAFDMNYNTSVYAEPDVQGELGRFYVNNRGNEASAPLHAKITFDTSVLGVMNLELGCAPGHIIDKVHIKTDSGVDKDVEVNRTCSVYGYAGAISYVDLGLERFDYINEVEYDFGAIPAGFQIAHSAHDSLAIAYTGRMLSDDARGVATLTLSEVDNPDHIIGPANTTTKHVDGAGTLDITNLGTQIINAGNSLNFSVNVKNWAGGTNYDNTVLSPVIYIRQEAKDAAGNFLPISNLRITTDSIRGSKDITELFGDIEFTDTDTARVYKIDGRNVPDGRASLSGTYVGEDGRIGESSIVVSWTVNTDLSTPDQQYKIADMFFAQDPNRNAAITTHYMRGDPYGVSGSANNTIYAATPSYYQIRGWKAINVENSGKHVSSSDWLTWNEGANPITIGAVDGSYANMRVAFSNNSGVDVPGPTTVYVPIPKVGQNWGQLSKDAADFEFSVALDSELENPNPNSFTIAYGQDVVPTDSGLEIEAQSEKFSTDTSTWTDEDWAKVNCVRIIAHNIAANEAGVIDNYDFTYRLKVIDANNIPDGATDTWRPTYYQQLTNSVGDVFSGWYRGSYVSVKLADGKVSGRLFIDTNENGLKEAGEDYLNESGWTVRLYDANSGRLVRETETSAQGIYNFIELAMGEKSYYATVENKHPIDSTSNPKYIFAPKADNEESYSLNNQASGDASANPRHLSARISGITPSKTTGTATYNIGLVNYVPTEQYKISVAFDDNENVFNTRPSTATLTDSDGSTLVVSAPLAATTYDLQKYDDDMNHWKHQFTAQDIAGYDKTLTTSNDGYTIAITYTLKKYTLTIKHLIEGFNTVIDESKSECSYGEEFSSQPITNDARLELKSSDGAESGIVRDDVEVKYYYILRRGRVITHYYIEGTTKKIADDSMEDYEIGDEYTTSPLNLDGYELVSESDTSSSGTVDSLNLEVAYYYRELPTAREVASTPNTLDQILDYLWIAGACVVGIIAAVLIRKNVLK